VALGRRAELAVGDCGDADSGKVALEHLDVVASHAHVQRARPERPGMGVGGRGYGQYGSANGGADREQSTA
jgi:hypothetical protein